MSSLPIHQPRPLACTSLYFCSEVWLWTVFILDIILCTNIGWVVFISSVIFTYFLVFITFFRNNKHIKTLLYLNQSHLVISFRQSTILCRQRDVFSLTVSHEPANEAASKRMVEDLISLKWWNHPLKTNPLILLHPLERVLLPHYILQP